MMRIVSFIFLMMIVVACGRHDNENEVKNYFQYIDDPAHGFVKKIDGQDKHYELIYKPLNYVALLEMRKTDFDKSDLDSVKRLFENSLAFTLTLSCDSCSLNQESSGSSTSYLDFEIKNDLKLINNADTFPCKLCYHERPNGGSTKHKIVMAFDKFGSPSTKGFQLIFNDNLFQNGIKTFFFNAKDLNSEPGLNL